MTKLQKQPPAYPGKRNSAEPLQTAVPYEDLPRTTQQPVPVTTVSQNDLPSTNPFSPNFNPQPVPFTTQSFPFSPISPLEPTPPERLSQPQIHAPQPRRPDAAQRRSMDLRRLDGKPYPSSNSAEKPTKQVKVAKDMHDGALPPVYKRQASDPINPAEAAQALSNTRECLKCGNKRDGEGPGHNGHGQGCNLCGKRKAPTPGPAPAATPPPSAPHARTVPEGTTSHQSQPSDSTAGPSSSPTSTPGANCCAKCGKKKRPSSIPKQQLPTHVGRPHGNGPASAPMPMAHRPAMKMHSARLSIHPNVAGTHNPVYPQIDVIPPSASSYKHVSSPFTSYGEDDSPLVAKATKQEFKVFRNSSLARSLSRHLSKKDKGVVAPLPSQQLAADENQSGEQSAGRLINMISSAMQGPLSDRDAQYSRLEVGDQSDRPQTPFSFVGGKDDQDMFEMVDLRERESEDDSLKEVVGREVSATRSDGDYSAIPQDTIDVIPRPKSTEPRGQFLSVQDAEQRPPITRFKSLRNGVSRMNSISRSTSLKRLGSLKTVHHNWYRDDMAIEGATGDNVVPVY
ncbi:uncharacterized protein Z518_00817 [Rhinocladiella mackenziei CBS 650.93]|uniref:Uncharacterized protein n=1 Tax=Rhinocladiella mackenziei CBS 650.93 TaxID=1442369 RepID=A0A0D2J205_9EURO|nr:uncharacterized protein Z518_00817 [Rhinocladiella mackenziei CBS 650.93]KIX09736.1 hypothetical protein Z518_00817 [Rhinocladiella mackenziei CBS 650.93]